MLRIKHGVQTYFRRHPVDTFNETIVTDFSFIEMLSHDHDRQLGQRCLSSKPDLQCAGSVWNASFLWTSNAMPLYWLL